MKIIRDHIKSGEYKPFYLLYGRENYLKKLYKDKLKDAILDDDDEMNYSYYTGKSIDEHEVHDAAVTLPFFSEKRLIVIENSGLFKKKSQLADSLQSVPDTTIIVFVEEEIDRRNRLYKIVRDKGTVSEMDGLSEKNLKLFVVSLLEEDNKRITERTVDYFLDKTGSDMGNIQNEIKKLVSYGLDRDVITNDDIDAVVTTQISGKIFNMIDAIGLKKQSQALELYYDLLSSREKPMSILFLITRHFNILLQVEDYNKRRYPSSQISKMAGIPPFTVKKYIGQTRNFTKDKLKKALELCIDIEERIKTGNIIDKIGVELIIVTLSNDRL